MNSFIVKDTDVQSAMNGLRFGGRLKLLSIKLQ